MVLLQSYKESGEVPESDEVKTAKGKLDEAETELEKERNDKVVSGCGCWTFDVQAELGAWCRRFA